MAGAIPRPPGRYMIQPDSDLELAGRQHPAGVWALLAMDSVTGLLVEQFPILTALAMLHDVDLWTPAGVPVGYRVAEVAPYTGLSADTVLAHLEDLANQGLVIQRGDLFRPQVIAQ